MPRTYHHAAVEANLGVILGEVEVVHHLVHVREDLREGDGIDEADDAEGRELGLGDGSDLVGPGRFLFFEGAVAVEGVIVVEEPASLFVRRLGGTGGVAGVDGHGALSSRGWKSDWRRAACRKWGEGYKREGRAPSLIP